MGQTQEEYLHQMWNKAVKSLLAMTESFTLLIRGLPMAVGLECQPIVLQGFFLTGPLSFCSVLTDGHLLLAYKKVLDYFAVDGLYQITKNKIKLK